MTHSVSKCLTRNQLERLTRAHRTFAPANLSYLCYRDEIVKNVTHHDDITSLHDEMVLHNDDVIDNIM